MAALNMRVVYALDGPDLEPSDVNQETGVSSTRAWSRSQPLRNGRPRAEGRWVLASSAETDADFNTHMDSIVQLLRHNWPAFVSLGRRHQAYVEAIVEVATQQPTIEISKASIAAMAELNAELLVEVVTDAGEDG
jgi:hypothetical protein